MTLSTVGGTLSTVGGTIAGLGGGAAASFVAATADADGNNSMSMFTAAVPTGVQDGDLLLAAVAHQATRTVTPPAGWTLVAGAVAGGNPDLRVYKKTASGEAGSYGFGLSAASFGGLVVLAFRDADVDASAVASTDTDGSGNITTPTVTTTAANDILVAFVSANGAAPYTFTPPGSMTERAEGSARFINVSGSTEVIAAAGATGTRTFGTSPAQTGTGGAQVVVALKAA